ncbi:MAG: hypothetical protein ABIP03_09585 [Aquihabitans sp.]
MTDLDVDPNVLLFASWVRSEEQKEKDARRNQRVDREAANAAKALVEAKDAAAAVVKRLRSSTSATADERSAADATYREALAAVVAEETGAAPDWAPPPAEDAAESHDEVAPDASTDEASTDEASTDEVSAGATNPAPGSEVSPDVVAEPDSAEQG